MRYYWYYNIIYIYNYSMFDPGTDAQKHSPADRKFSQETLNTHRRWSLHQSAITWGMFQKWGSLVMGYPLAGWLGKILLKWMIGGSPILGNPHIGVSHFVWNQNILWFKSLVFHLTCLFVVSPMFREILGTIGAPPAIPTDEPTQFGEQMDPYFSCISQ